MKTLKNAFHLISTNVEYVQNPTLISDLPFKKIIKCDKLKDVDRASNGYQLRELNDEWIARRIRQNIFDKFNEAGKPKTSHAKYSVEFNDFA